MHCIYTALCFNSIDRIHRLVLACSFEIISLNLLDFMSSQLIIYGAAYGPQDVTGKVRRLRNNQELSIVANNETFVDTWLGHKKSLIVVYK